MTTEFSTIYDALVTRLGTTLFSGHKRLSNPYNLAQNNDQVLEKGWGLAVREGENTNRLVGKNTTVRRSFDIVLTRKYFAREFDAAKKADAEKTLLEDLQILIDSAEGDTDLVPASGKYVFRYLGDSGITQVKDDRDDFLAVVVSTSVEYFRPIP